MGNLCHTCVQKGSFVFTGYSYGKMRYVCECGNVILKPYKFIKNHDIVCKCQVFKVGRGPYKRDGRIGIYYKPIDPSL